MLCYVTFMQTIAFHGFANVSEDLCFTFAVFSDYLILESDNNG